HPADRKAGSSDRPKLVSPLQLFRLHPIVNRGDLAQRHLLKVLQGLNVEVLNICQTSPLLHMQADGHWNLLVSLSKDRDLIPVQSRRRRSRDIQIRESS